MIIKDSIKVNVEASQTRVQETKRHVVIVWKTSLYNIEASHDNPNSTLKPQLKMSYSKGKKANKRYGDCCG